MKGFPKHINTKDDLYILKTDFPNEVKTFVTNLIESSNEWLMTSILVDTDPGITDATHKIVIDTFEGKTTRYQYEYKLDPNAYIFRLGLTLDEAKTFI